MREFRQLPTSMIDEIIDCSAVRPVGLKETFFITNVLQLPRGTIPMRALIISIVMCHVNIFRRLKTALLPGVVQNLQALEGTGGGSLAQDIPEIEIFQ